MAAPHRGHNRRRAARFQASDAHQIGVVEIVARVVVHQIAHHKQAQLGQAASGLRPDTADLGQGRVQVEAQGSGLGAGAGSQPQPGRG
jgi:hypothetical protein